MSMERVQEEPRTLRVELLGRFRVYAGPRAIADDAWRLRKAQSLVKLLALAPSQRLHREQALDALWPDLEPVAAMNNLHRTLHAIRRTLDPDLAATTPSPYVRLHNETLALSPHDTPWIDVTAFTEAAGAARQGRDPAVFEAALALYSGDLLPDDPYEEWVIGRREQLRGLYLDVLMELARLRQAREEYDAAIGALEQVVAHEPAHEEGRLGIMRLRAQLGQRYQALRQYQQLRDALRRDLDVAPGHASQRLYQDILSSRFPDGQRPTPVSGPTYRERSLARLDSPVAIAAEPAGPPAGFIGRERELATVASRLAEARLLTLTGAGGCGKTRLALETAARIRADYADGASMVELAALADPGLVTQAVAAVLGVREEPVRPLDETLAGALRSKQMLVVLDNCEQVRDACARLVAALLQACPYLRILVTSRRPLGVAGEAVWRVPSLTTPDLQRLPALNDLMEYDAVRLFIERARAIRPGFTLTERNALDVARACHRLDGIPLAIELTAVWVRALTIEDLAARLDDMVDLLVTDDGATPPRQRTLRATMDWSYDLLDAPERTLLRRLAVFRGGWTLEAAEAVCTDQRDGEGLGQKAVLHALRRLVDASLVIAEEQEVDEGAGVSGGMRYRLLEPVRQYAYDKLRDASEDAPVRKRHAKWYMELTEQAEPELTGPRQARWMDRLEREHDNLRVALRGALESGKAEVGLRLAGALWRFWYQHGHLDEGRRWLDDAVELAHGDDRAATAGARAKVLNGAGVLASDQGDFARATALQEESLALRRELGDMHGTAASLNNLGVLARYQGQLERAEAIFQESLTLRREIGDIWGVAGSLSNLSSVVAEQGELPRAIILQEESLVLRRELGDKVTIGLALTNLGVLARYQGQYEQAAAFLEEGLALRSELGDKWGAANALANLGNVAVDQDDDARAVAAYRQSLTLCRDIGDKRTIPYCLEGLAAVACARGHAERAARLCGAADALRSVIGAPLPPVERPMLDRTVAAVRATMDTGSPQRGRAFAAAWSAGQALTLEQAIAEALVVEAAVPSPSSSTAHASKERRGEQRAPLSQREGDIATLVATGRTNDQITAELGIAKRTVDTHVDNILKKLGLSSRAEVAARLSE